MNSGGRNSHRAAAKPRRTSMSALDEVVFSVGEVVCFFVAPPVIYPDRFPSMLSGSFHQHNAEKEFDAHDAFQSETLTINAGSCTIQD